MKKFVPEPLEEPLVSKNDRTCNSTNGGVLYEGSAKWHYTGLITTFSELFTPSFVLLSFLYLPQLFPFHSLNFRSIRYSLDNFGLQRILFLPLFLFLPPRSFLLFFFFGCLFQFLLILFNRQFFSSFFHSNAPWLMKRFNFNNTRLLFPLAFPYTTGLRFPSYNGVLPHTYQQPTCRVNFYPLRFTHAKSTRNFSVGNFLSEKF